MHRDDGLASVTSYLQKYRTPMIPAIGPMERKGVGPMAGTRHYPRVPSVRPKLKYGKC